MTVTQAPATTEEQAKLQSTARFVLSSRSFERFLDFVYIMEPPPGAGRIKFAKWPHNLQMARDLTEHRLICTLKARQLGWSWIMAAYAVWNMMFKEGSLVLMLSKGQFESKELLSKARFIYRNLPDDWQWPLATDSSSEIAPKGKTAKIVALPSTEDAGRSETASVVIQDEADFHEFLDSNYAAVKPTIDAGGQMLMGSTSNKRKLISLFKELYRGGPDNGWHVVFWPWTARPGRDQEWFDQVKRNVPSLDELTAEGMSPDLYMEQNYPVDAQEALAPPKSIGAFDQDMLKDMQELTRKPTSVIDGAINIYQGFRAGGRYGAGTDTAHGTGYDFSVTTVIDLKSGNVVADIMSNSMQPEDLAHHSLELLKRYGSPIWGIEDNEWGIVVVKAAQEARYPRIYKHKTGRGAEHIGWHTDGKTRWELWGELQAAVNAGQITVFSSPGLSQFFSVILNPDKGHRPEAMKGAHDDYPVAVGIAWQMRKKSFVMPNVPVMSLVRW